MSALLEGGCVFLSLIRLTPLRISIDCNASENGSPDAIALRCSVACDSLVVLVVDLGKALKRRCSRSRVMDPA